MHTNSEKKILICTNYRVSNRNPSCGAKGSFELLEILKAQNLGITIEEAPCMGRCQHGPNLHIVPNGPWLDQLSTDQTTIHGLVARINAYLDTE